MRLLVCLHHWRSWYPQTWGALFARLPGVLCARRTFFHVIPCTRVRDPLFCILPPFCETFLRLKRRKMFVSRLETAMLCVCVGQWHTKCTKVVQGIRHL